MREIGERLEQRHEAVQQLQAVLAECRVLVHHQHVLEERVDGLAHPREALEHRRVRLLAHQLVDARVRVVKREGERDLIGGHQRLVRLGAQVRLRQVLRPRERDRQVLHVVTCGAKCRKRLGATACVERVVRGHGQYGSDSVVGVAALLEQHVKAAEQELAHRRANRFGIDAQCARVALKRSADRLIEPEPHSGEHHLQHADRRAPKRVRVGGAGGSHAGGEDADNRVELVGDGHEAAGLRRGRLVTREPRLVVLENGLCHLGLLAGRQRVVAPHHALQRRELHNDAAHEIGLAQMTRPSGVRRDVRASADHLGEADCKRLDALGLRLQGAQPLLEHDALELGDPGLERVA